MIFDCGSASHCVELNIGGDLSCAIDSISPFPVDDIQAAENFYTQILGVHSARRDTHWIDFDFWDHQLTVHQVKSAQGNPAGHNPVDGDTVPVPHFGIILSVPEWKALEDRLKSLDVTFVIEGRLRFEGQVGEQWTMFIRDPAGNTLEFKALPEGRGPFETV